MDTAMVDKELVVGGFIYHLCGVLQADQDEISLRSQYKRLRHEPGRVTAGQEADVWLLWPIM
jgi:hypothetical protein